MLDLNPRHNIDYVEWIHVSIKVELVKHSVGIESTYSLAGVAPRQNASFGP